MFQCCSLKTSHPHLLPQSPLYFFLAKNLTLFWNTSWKRDLISFPVLPTENEPHDSPAAPNLSREGLENTQRSTEHHTSNIQILKTFLEGCFSLLTHEIPQRTGIFPALSVHKDVTVISYASPPGNSGRRKIPIFSSHQAATEPYNEPQGSSGCEKHKKLAAEMHMKGMISLSPDSCIFSYILNSLIWDI